LKYKSERLNKIFDFIFSELFYNYIESVPVFIVTKSFDMFINNLYTMQLNVQSNYNYLMSSAQQQINAANINSAAVLCANNPAIHSVVRHLLPGYSLDMALSSISLEENGKCNYYYATNGGLR
jgi:hypothetical protein